MVNKTRINEIDIAKGIGIILVIIGHCLPNNSLLRLMIYSFHMPLFFFLSGMVLDEEKIKEEKKCLCKFFDFKIAIWYLLFSAIYLLFDFVVRYQILGVFNIKTLFWECYQTVALYGINVLWFLSTLVLAKAIAYIIENFTVDNLKLRACLIVALFFMGGGIALFVQEPTSGALKILWYPVCNFIRSLIMSAFILIGYDMKKVIIHVFASNICWEKSGLIIAFLVMFILYLCRLLYRCDVEIDIHKLKFGFLPVTILLALCGICGIVLLSNLINRYSSILKKGLIFVGTNSLFIMLTHEHLMVREYVSGLFLWVECSLIKYVMIVITIICVETILIRIFSKPLNALVNNLYNSKGILTSWK